MEGEDENAVALWHSFMYIDRDYYDGLGGDVAVLHLIHITSSHIHSSVR